MTSPTSGGRRTGRIAVAAAIAAALTAAGPLPAFAGQPVTTANPAPDKLGSQGAGLLAKAKADGDKTVTMMFSTTPGETGRLAGRLGAIKGASVGKVYDKLGYLRVTVPTAKADAAIAQAERLSSVESIDLKEQIRLPDPTPHGDTVPGAGAGAGAGAGKGRYPAPGKDTPAKNPYQPAFETGAVDFVKEHPKADGRGVTIGILDSGVDLAHPALQKTTTGERKIIDWVTATDPLLDGDGTWLPMTTDVHGPSFTFNGRTYTAPEGDYRVALFKESATLGGDMQGDLNRDGDTTDSWAVLYDPKKGTVRVDLDDDGDFRHATEMKPYKDGFQVGYFGKQDPKSQVATRIPFTVQIRKDVPMDPKGGDWVGKKADFVNIGVIESEHGTHVAGITAANGLFGGRMNGAAPGAKIVSSRACTWSGGCTNVALKEGMIDLVVNHGVDIINMSIGGLRALNDGNDDRDKLYTRLIDQYGVQLVISAGNDGPGANTIGNPGLADKVISVGAAVSKETWAANYGSQVTTPYAMMPFSSRGPREDGGFTPTLTAPGASINTTPTWEPGAPVAEAGYQLPAGYGMLQGTSMASPQAAGASALLISAAKQQRMHLTPADLRTALTSTARQIKGVQAYAQGAGLIDIRAAWKSLRHGATAHDYQVKAPVDTVLSGRLKTPGFGTGIYDREGGLQTGRSKTYPVTLTRTSGPAGAVWHELKWRNNDGTFSLAGPGRVRLPLNKPVTVKVKAKPRTAGIHTAILAVNDPHTEGIDLQLMTTVVVSEPLGGQHSGTVQRNATRSYFVTVPKGTKTLQLRMDGLRPGSQTRFIAIDSRGMTMDPTSTPNCYPNYSNPKNTCRPDQRSYADPTPGVWEIEVEARRTSPLLDNPYVLTATAQGAQ